MPAIIEPGGLGRGRFKSRPTPGTFPLSWSANGRYLQTLGGAPFLLNSSSAWGLIAGLSLANAQAYVDARVAQGFNNLIVCLVVANDTIPPNTETWLGSTAAFTSAGNLSTPNSTYFAHADDVIDYCATKGVFLWLNPIYLGWYGGDGSGSSDLMRADSDAHCASYGTYLGGRYGARSNVGWCLGGDQYPEFRNATTAAREQALAIALKAAAPSQLYTAHLDSSGDATRFQDSGMHCWDGTEYRTYFAAPYGVNGHYAFAEQSGTLIYTRDRDAHAQSPTMPHFHLDESYEGETNGTALEIRTRQHRASCEGCCGGAFNAGSIWYTNFDTSTGSTGQTQNIYWWGFWSALAWHTLVPDSSDAYVTAGRGTYGTSGYVCATANATLLVAHFPSGGANTITVAMAQFSKPMIGRWWDPTSNTSTPINSGAPIANSGTQNFTNPGNNASGSASDWLLVLE